MALDDGLGLDPGGLGVRGRQAVLDELQAVEDAILGRLEDGVDHPVDEVAVGIEVDVLAGQPAEVRGGICKGVL